VDGWLDGVELAVAGLVVCSGWSIVVDVMVELYKYALNGIEVTV
jgi:hypothetical protein